MALFRRPPYDRARILDAATRAVARRKKRQAIDLYRQILVVEPQNVELHWKLAPLLADTRQRFDAFRSYQTVAERFLSGGVTERALAVYREATRHLPKEVRAWEAVARLQRRAGRSEDAIDTLLEGSVNLRKRKHRPEAIHLLRGAREIDEWNFQVVLSLALLLDRSRQPREAEMLLDGLADRVLGRRLRRVRAIQVRRSPTPAACWRWLRQLFADEEPPPKQPAPKPQDPPANLVPLPVFRAR